MNLWLLCGHCHQIAAHVHIVHRIGGGSTALFTVNKQTDELAFLQAYVVRKSTTQTNTIHQGFFSFGKGQSHWKHYHYPSQPWNPWRTTAPRAIFVPSPGQPVSSNGGNLPAVAMP
jgi:hypothetical protein